MPVIASAARNVEKRTYVPLKLDTSQVTVGSALMKFSFVQQLALQAGEVDAARQAVAASGGTGQATAADATLWNTLRAFEGTPIPSQLPAHSVFAAVSPNTLLSLGRTIVDLRQQKLSQSASDASGIDRANTGRVAVAGFEKNVAATPIGMLNLERVEMAPAGIVRGDLLSTVCLAPREKTSVVQKEWSVTSQEFTSIVTDSLANYSDTGVSENTELAQSTTSQVQHSNQFNINTSASGGCGFISGSISTGFQAQDANSQSATDSNKHAIQTTRQASSRTKQSHKMTISTQSVTGSGETTARVLENPSDTDPMRIDYFSLMSQWRVRLYRYGLRLTYDIAVPEPGGAMRAIYKQLDELQSQAGGAFVFDLKYQDITPASLPSLMDRYGAQLPPPPKPKGPLTPNASGEKTLGLDKTMGWHFYSMPISVDDGYWITKVVLVARVGLASGHGADWSYPYHIFGIVGLPLDQSATSDYNWDLTSKYNYLTHYTGTQAATFFFQGADTASVQLTVSEEPTPATMEQWQISVWTACYNAAQSAYYAKQQQINAQIQALQAKITGIDTLTLRREEQDEIMKCVLRWLLGTGFDFMPQSVIDLFKKSGGDLKHGVSFTGNDLGLLPANWTTMFQYQEMVKFINEALEWENVTYFLYSYFWDVPRSWDFIRQIQHPDATRQAFLRAGSARIVLTVRKGYETAWTSFVELGDLAHAPIPGHPYMTIAQEIANYDSTNYPGITAANPDGQTGEQLDPAFALCSGPLTASASPVNIEVDSSAGFIVGEAVVIDVYDSGVQETQMLTAVPDATHLIVAQLSNAHDGTTNAFPVTQPGDKGLLIGEWFEYTPSSGTDIAVNSDLATIA